MAHRRGRILYICGTPLIPSKVGPARRNYHIVDQLSRFFDVDVIAFGEPRDVVTFRASLRAPIRQVIFLPRRTRFKHVRKVWHSVQGRCDFLAAYDARVRSTAAQLASTSNCDAVVLSTLLLGRLPLPCDVPIVADTHNVEYDVCRRVARFADSAVRRAHARRQYACTKAEEQRSGRAADLVFATSDRDRRLFEEELRLDNVVVVPNGIDPSEFHPAGAVDSAVIVFSGLMSWYPNEQGVRWFLDQVFPEVVRRIPAVRLVVAGAAPPAWLRSYRDPHVEVTGAVADMRPHLARARAAVVPLKIGGGTRVKILEAQAMGKPVVSTAVGAEGLEQTHDLSIVIADDATAFAAQVVRLLTDDIAAARIGEGGRRHALARFSWDDIGARLARTLEDRLGLVPGGYRQVERATC